MADHFSADDKQVDEIITLAVEYKDKLASGETLSTTGATAKRKDTGADATAAFIAGSSIAGTQARVKVQDGISGVNYQVEGFVTTSLGHRFDYDISIRVVTP